MAGMSATSLKPRKVVVLGGGPDSEREVSLKSSKAVAESLRKSGRFDVQYHIIDRLTAAGLRGLEGDVIFPVLHGGYGEGGPLQDLLEQDGRAYVGCRPQAARIAMDKVLTKSVALRLGIPTAEFAIYNHADEVCPLALPVVVKPVHEGSSVGLHIVHDDAAWVKARRAVAKDHEANPSRVYMIERYVAGRELTVGLLDPLGEKAASLPLIEIQAASGVYDYDAKYERGDTKYVISPTLMPGLDSVIRQYAQRLARGAGIRHLCRVDFRLDRTNTPWLLEVNTMPGFTDHSLVPMAAKDVGIDFAALCGNLVEYAVRDGRLK
jgi:D-alanine-D-alanine ligase